MLHAPFQSVAYIIERTVGRHAFMAHCGSYFIAQFVQDGIGTVFIEYASAHQTESVDELLAEFVVLQQV